jgi:predicted dehydrogenase
MRSLLVGLGSIGRRHLANLRLLDPDGRVTVWHQHTTPEQEAAHPSGADRVVYCAEDALDSAPDLAIIAGPAPLHVPAALTLVDHRIPLLIEKPLSNTLDGVELLCRRVHEHRVTVLIGYVLRFAPPLQLMRREFQKGAIGRALAIRAEVGQYLPDWRPGTDYRTGVTARASLGGGAVLELSHELDYARWLLGEVTSVWGRTARSGSLQLDVEDVAEIGLEFEGGALGSVHLDLVQRPPVRCCRIVGAEGTLTWDGLTNEVRCFRPEERRWVELHPAVELDRNGMYIEEMRHFLACVRGHETPGISLLDGRRVLEIALGVKRSSETGQVIRI